MVLAAGHLRAGRGVRGVAARGQSGPRRPRTSVVVVEDSAAVYLRQHGAAAAGTVRLSRAADETPQVARDSIHITIAVRLSGSAQCSFS